MGAIRLALRLRPFMLAGPAVSEDTRVWLVFWGVIIAIILVLPWAMKYAAWVMDS